MTVPSDRLPLYSLVTLSGKDKVNILIIVGFGRASAARTCIFRLCNTQTGALCAPCPAHRSFTDPSGEIKDI